VTLIFNPQFPREKFNQSNTGKRVAILCRKLTKDISAIPETYMDMRFQPFIFICFWTFLRSWPESIYAVQKTTIAVQNATELWFKEEWVW